ncbi:MAG: class I SAM-dependent methyltransferase [Salaquimonas sp.]|nr:class I SAM-dependent methyltransferase [Salaquimonas sp.]
MEPLPDEFDATFYRDLHVDLAYLNESELRAHYYSFGRQEGRASSAPSLKENFLKLVPRDRPVLEVGPFTTPAIEGDNVRYFEVLDRDALIRRAQIFGLPDDNVPEIHYMDPNGDLSAVPDKFSAVVSSHCIEHQPDLVHHLQQVSALLEPGGYYFLVIPDKRYCFDHFLAESTIAKVVAAHRAGQRTHRLESVLEHRALTTHNDPVRHWAGDHADENYWQSIAVRVLAAMTEFDNARGSYVDVHAWQFTPNSFKRIITCLADIGLGRFLPERVYATPNPRLEFTAVLRRI